MKNTFSLILLILFMALVFASSSAAAEGPKSGVRGFKGVMSKGDKRSKAPLFIKSDSLRVDAIKRVFVYQGNVEARQGEIVVTSERMTGTYDENNKLQTVECENNVVITRGSSMRATSDYAHYNVAQAVIELTQGPELISEGNALTADKVKIYVDEDRSEAEGNVRVKVLSQEGAEGADPFAP